MPKSFEFVSYQLILAIKGEWSELEARSFEALKATGAVAVKVRLDHEFFNALAQKDLERMTRVLSKLTIPKNIANRSDMENGYCDGLFSRFATMYAKIA